MLALAACVVGCGESSQPPAYVASDGYLKALAEGNYSSACAQLDPRARARVDRSPGHRVSCARAFTLCLPNRVRVLKKDQTQLLYATVDINIDGSTASAQVSGTPVANAVKHFTLADQRGHWKLTSYGQELTGCRRPSTSTHR